MNRAKTYEPVIINGQSFPIESEEEKWFLWWAGEMMQAGHIKSLSRGQTKILSENTKVHDRVVGKDGKVLKNKPSVLLMDQVYTPDFEIVWSGTEPGFAEYFSFIVDKPTFRTNIRATGAVGETAGAGETELFSLIEVKGGFMDANQKRISSILIKWTMQRYGLYVQLVQLHNDKNSFFDRTFTPMRYLLTDKTMKPRSLKYTPRSLDDWFASLRKQQAIV